MKQRKLGTTWEQRTLSSALKPSLWSSLSFHHPGPLWDTHCSNNTVSHAGRTSGLTWPQPLFWRDILDILDVLLVQAHLQGWLRVMLNPTHIPFYELWSLSFSCTDDDDTPMAHDTKTKTTALGVTIKRNY